MERDVRVVGGAFTVAAVAMVACVAAVLGGVAAIGGWDNTRDAFPAGYQAAAVITGVVAFLALGFAVGVMWATRNR